MKDGQVSVSHYTTDVFSDDWADRAFVFGSTSFVLSLLGTNFNIDDHGNKSITGGAMLPYDTDFGLETNSPLATQFNQLYLHDLLDPYDIGRTVNFNFTSESKNDYINAHRDDTYSVYSSLS